MRNTPAIALLSIGLCLSSLPLGAQTLPLEQRIFILSKTYATIPVQFAHWRTASIDPGQLDAVFKEYLSRAVATESRKDFALLMREFIALLNNGHSWYGDAKAFGSVLSMGFSFTRISGEWVAHRSSIEGLKPGDIVSRIDGKPVAEHFQSLSKYLSGPNERSKRTSFLSLLTVLCPPRYTLEAVDQAGKTVSLTVDRTLLKTESPPMKTESRWLKESRIGYLKVPSFGAPEFEQDALEQLKEFAAATVLIVDVRSNSGGSTPSRLTKALMNKRYRWWTESTPLTIGLFRYYREAQPAMELNEFFTDAQLMWRGAETAPDPDAFQGGLIILTNERTGSAAEDFVLPFKDNGRAMIVGETTNGSTGQPYMYDFGDGISIGIGTKRAYMPNGEEFEGIGIPPDIAVALTRQDLYQGKDRILETAIAEAEKLSGGAKK